MYCFAFSIEQTNVFFDAHLEIIRLTVFISIICFCQLIKLNMTGSIFLFM